MHVNILRYQKNNRQHIGGVVQKGGHKEKKELRGSGHQGRDNRTYAQAAIPLKKMETQQWIGGSKGGTKRRRYYRELF